MLTTFKAEEIPADVQAVVSGDEQIRCPHFSIERGRICNRLLCVGRASLEPQEFKCPNCGEKTTFKRL